MARGWRDFTVPIAVEAVTVESLPIDVKAQTLGTLAVDIKAQTLGQLNVNIAAAAVSINIKTAGGEHVDTDIVGSVTLPINIVAQTISTLAVDIKAQTLGQLNVNIASSAVTLNVAIQSSAATLNVAITSAVTLNVNIAAQDVDVNVKTSGGANIVVDKLTQTAVDARYQRLLRTDDPPPSLVNLPLTDVNFHQHYPRGARGFIEKVRCYLKNADSANAQSIVLAFSPFPGLGEVFTATVTVPAAGGWGWYEADVRKMWNFDSCFVWTKTGNSYIFYATHPERYGAFTWTGSEWTALPYACAIALDVYSLTPGDLPVSGTVNTIEVPSVFTKFGLYSSGPVDGGAQADILPTVYGCGALTCFQALFEKVENLALNTNQVLGLVVDDAVFEVSMYDLARPSDFVANAYYPVSFSVYNSTYMRFSFGFNFPLKFKRSLRIYAKNTAAPGNVLQAYALIGIEMLS